MFQLSGFYYKPIIKRPIKVGISHVHPLITKPNVVGISLSTAAYAHVIFGSLIKKVTTLGTTRIPTRATTRGCDHSYCKAYELHGPLKIHVEVTTREINLRALHWASTHYSKGCIGFAKKVSCADRVRGTKRKVRVKYFGQVYCARQVQLPSTQIFAALLYNLLVQT